MKNFRRKLLVITLAAVAVGASVIGTSGPAAAADGPRPDLIIREPSVGAAWIGEGVYNTNGAGQTIFSGAPVGESVRAESVLQNEGPGIATFRVSATDGNASFGARYKLNGTNVTKQLRGNGSVDVSLAVGYSASIIVVSKVKPGGLDYHATFQVTARSRTANQLADAVRLQVVAQLS